MSTWNTIIPNRFNLFTDTNFCFKKKKIQRSEIAVLVVKEICPGSWLDSCSTALARAGENWQESGAWGVEEEELISIFRAGENCSILEQLLLLSWKYHKPSPWTYFIVHNGILHDLCLAYYKKIRLSSCVQAHGDSQIEKLSKVLCLAPHFLFKANYSSPHFSVNGLYPTLHVTAEKP